MLRLTKSMGFMVALSALMLVGCPKKYEPSDDAGTPENTAAACSDSVDNDGDGDIDCADSDCQDAGFCVETDCSNGIDDDGDGNTDCADSDCQGTFECEENTSAACDDNIDNDGDGFVDCADTECAGIPPCDHESICDDNLDNDGDNDVDCDDDDCAEAANCGGFCYGLTFQTPSAGAALTPADDLSSTEACIQYQVSVFATDPEPSTQVCLYLDSLGTQQVGCQDPNAANPVVFDLNGTNSLCAGTHTLYARVEQGTNTCTTANLGLEQITFQVYEAPSCSITLPTNLVTVQGDAVCYNQSSMDVEVTTTGADAELWINGAMAGFGTANMGIVAFTGTSLADEGLLTFRAHCDNPGSGNGDTWSADYYIIKDTVAPGVSITSPTSPASFVQNECPFTVTVTGVEDGAQVCATYQNGPTHANGCATSTGTTQTYDLTVDCINGQNMTVEAVATDPCGNTSTDSIVVNTVTNIPTVIIEHPANGQVYSKVADTVDPATDSFEAVITACTDGPYDPTLMVLEIDSTVENIGVPTVVAASCLGLSHRITWPVSYAFSQVGPMQTNHTVAVTVTNGNQATDTVTFANDMIAPVLDFTCASCAPSDDFILPSMDSCAGSPVDVFVRVSLDGLEVGQQYSLAVTAGGNPVGTSPYSQTATTSGPQLPSWTCIEIANGQNLLEVTATDAAGNVAIPAQKVVTMGDGAILSPMSGAVLSVGDDCDTGGAFGIPVEIQVGHSTVANGTSISVTATGGSSWSYSAPAWSKSCTGDPCTHTFCVPVPTSEVEQNNIALVMAIGAATVPGGPTGITVDISESGPPTGLSRTLVNRRAAEVQLDWTSVEDAQTGLLQSWDVRCVVDGTIAAGNWSGAMQFAGEPTPAAAGTTQTVNIAEDINGAKIRAGHSYSCGIRGVNAVGLTSDVAVFADITVAELDFVQYPLTVTGYTWGTKAHIGAAGDVNGDGYDDMLVGYGDGTGHGAALYFGSSSGPSATASSVISCADSTFGRVVTGIGDFDGAVYSAGDANTYPDIAIGAPEEAAVYIWRGHDGIDTASLSCASADIIILGVPGSGFGTTVTALGDFDDDGIADIAIGAPTADGWDGKVYVVFGRAESGYPGVTIDLTTGALARGALEIESPFTSSSVGHGLSAGDLDNDGHSDLIFASNWGGAAGEGTFSVLLGYPVTSKPVNTVTPVPATAVDQSFEFSHPGALTPQFGRNLVAPMDFNGDGCLDLAIGSERSNVGAAGTAAGNVLVYLGENTGGVCTGHIVTPHAQSVVGLAAWDVLGYPVVPPLNGTIPVPENWRLNGLLTSPSDVAIIAGARQDELGVGTTGVGYVGLWYAGFSGNVTPTEADIVISGGTGAEGQHWAAFVGDLDGDGYVDLAIGDVDYGTGGRVLILH